MVTVEELYKAIYESVRDGESVCVATVVNVQGSTPRESGAKMVIWPDGRTMGTVGGGQLEARVLEMTREVFETGNPRMLHFRLRSEEAGDAGICGGDADVFVEPITSKPRLVIIGGGHVGTALAHAAALAGFGVTVMDTRALDGAQFPAGVSLVRLEGWDCLPREWFNEQTYVAIMTPQHSGDREALRQLLDLPVAYLGMIGSRRKVAVTFEALREEGASDEALSRVHAPIGLGIGAETPAEIAISIVAELIRVRKGPARSEQVESMRR